MKKIGVLTLLLVSSLFVMPFSAYAKATVTVTPATVAPGGTITISVNPNQNYINRFYWINKGQSNDALATGSFPCYQVCYYPTKSKFTIPGSWSEGSDYYVKIYDRSINDYIKTNFTVKR